MQRCIYGFYEQVPSLFPLKYDFGTTRGAAESYDPTGGAL